MRSRLEIDLNAVSHNLEEARRLSNNKEILAIVKADAYGLGAKKIVSRLIKESVRRFGVSCLEEALDIRPVMNENCFTYLMGHPMKEEVEGLVEIGAIVGVSSIPILEEIALISKKKNKKVLVMLAVDTGMGRLGFDADDLDFLDKKLKDFPFIKVESVYTHYSLASEVDSRLTKKQIERIVAIRRRYEGIVFHTSNSLAIEHLPQYHYDAVRPGLMLYGFGSQLRASLKEVVQFKSEVLLVRRLRRGWNIGYNGTYELKEDANIVTIPVGFADGYSLAHSNRGRVLIKKKSYPVVGRISMDYTTVNAGNDEISVGDEVLMMGGDSMSFEESASICRSHIHEVLTSFSKRVGRLYKEV